MSGNDAAEIEVWWDMKDCPIPEGYDASRVRPSIESAFKELGYFGPVSITAYGDQKQTPCHVLRGLSSTGVAVAHTSPESRPLSLMYLDIVKRLGQYTPPGITMIGQYTPPGIIMIISDQVEGDFSWDLARLQQRTKFKPFLAYSMRPCNDFFLLTSGIWRWEQLLEKGCAPQPLVGGGLSAMFYCKSCNFDCQNLKKFMKHLSSYKHGLEEAINHPGRQILCVTKTWARNYPATTKYATAKIHVLWDMTKCPIPKGYDASRVRPSIERAFKELGYFGPVSITAYGDKKETPDHHLLALYSTRVNFAHTLDSVRFNRMYSDFEFWIDDNPPPASFMFISDEATQTCTSSLISGTLQKSDYNCFLAYSVRPFKMPLLVTSAEWLWESLLAETNRPVLQRCSESKRVVGNSTGMFYCKLCYCDYKRLDCFNKHLSSKKHTQRENRMITNPQLKRLYRISDYHDKVGYPPKTKRMRKAPWKGFLPRPLRFTRR